jgi:hypothetical protein
MDNTMKRVEILSDFFKSVSDTTIEEIQQLNLETDFKEFMTNGNGELCLLDSVNEMCEESLSPETFEMWVKVKEELRNNRRLLKVYNWSI